MSVTYYLTKLDGLSVFHTANVPAETAAKGITSVTLTAQCTAASGITRHGEIRVTAKVGSVLMFSAPNLYFSGSDMENAIESTLKFHALDTALNAVGQAIKDAHSESDTVQKMLESDRQVISDADAATASANTDANAAAKAAADAAGGLASLNEQKKLVQMPTAADVGASNPNLLLNGDCSVWQRGTSFSVADASKYVYTADRWRVKSATTITKDSNGLKTAAACTLEQRLEDEDHRKIGGKTVTLNRSINGAVSSQTYTASSAVISIQLAAGDVLNWVKLEQGVTAMVFSPHPFAESTTKGRTIFW